MVGENFEIYSSQLSKNTFKSSTMVGEKFGIYSSQLVKNTLKLSTMVGENFDIYSSQFAKKYILIVHHGWRKFWNLLISIG